ncbi:MAG: 30S ribosomal protein S16 [candidate division Zixibacteria bacterium]|nr:30S ribosomal protein S16 [candidate division Zixibacteria bacterium]
MSVKIRLRRMGKKKQPMYRFVATDSRMPRDGRFLEVLGWYRPLERPAKVKVDVERTLDWLRKGATPSDTVNTLFHQCGMTQIWEKAQKGEDTTGMEIKDAITERPHKAKKKERAKMIAQEEADKKAAEDAKKAAEDAKKAEEAKAAEAEKPAEGGDEAAEAPAEEKSES